MGIEQHLVALARIGHQPERQRYERLGGRRLARAEPLGAQSRAPTSFPRICNRRTLSIVSMVIGLQTRGTKLQQGR